MSDNLSTNLFEAIGLSPFLASRVEERGIMAPTEIQKKVIPLLLEKRESVFFRSATGTGKTFAYLLPLIEILLKEKKEGAENQSGPRVLICAPTYELCSQIKEEADFLLAGTGLKTALLIGSAQTGRQIELIKKEKPVIAVGNPGRLLLLSDMNKLKTNALDFLVLDEGDRLVSRELFEETRALVSRVFDGKKPRGEICFVSCSATFSSKSGETLFSLSRGPAGEKPAIIDSDENILRDLVEHWAFFSEDRQKLGALRSFIAASGAFKKKGKTKTGRALIFTARGKQVGNIVSVLQHFKLDAAGLWGDMDKKARKQALDNFRSGKIRFLVTSDLAARGLDIPGLDYIIALDTGDEADGYVHRAGRTARAGRRGVMVTIGNEAELRRLAALEKKLKIKVYPKELYGGRIAAPEQLDEEPLPFEPEKKPLKKRKEAATNG